MQKGKQEARKADLDNITFSVHAKAGTTVKSLVDGGVTMHSGKQKFTTGNVSDKTNAFVFIQENVPIS